MSLSMTDIDKAQPIKQHPYRVNPLKRMFLQKEEDCLIAYNLAEPSYSSWSSPCTVVHKPDNSYRFCSDYRERDTLTKPDCFPLPRFDDCVEFVGSARFFNHSKCGYCPPVLKNYLLLLALMVFSSTVMPFGV